MVCGAEGSPWHLCTLPEESQGFSASLGFSLCSKVPGNSQDKLPGHACEVKWAARVCRFSVARQCLHPKLAATESVLGEGLLTPPPTAAALPL